MSKTLDAATTDKFQFLRTNRKKQRTAAAQNGRPTNASHLLSTPRAKRLFQPNELDWTLLAYELSTN